MFVPVTVSPVPRLHAVPLVFSRTSVPVPVTGLLPSVQSAMFCTVSVLLASSDTAPSDFSPPAAMVRCAPLLRVSPLPATPSAVFPARTVSSPVMVTSTVPLRIRFVQLIVPASRLTVPSVACSAREIVAFDAKVRLSIAPLAATD